MRRLASFAGLFLVVGAFIEITGIVLVASWLGNTTTVIALLLSSVAGCWVLRLEGRRAWRVLHERDSATHAPTAVADSLLGAVAGALLILPGFLSTIIAGVLLLPPVRRIVARRSLRRLGRWRPNPISERLRDRTHANMHVKSHRAQPREDETPRHTTLTPEGEGGVAEAEHMIVIAPEPEKPVQGGSTTAGGSAQK
ncbi:MAG: FxsA family protein [Mycobacteriales bacterium]